MESLCGYRPDEHGVMEFLTQLTEQDARVRIVTPVTSVRKLTGIKTRTQNPEVSTSMNSNLVGYELQGQFYPARNNRDVLVRTMQTFSSYDNAFLDQFSHHHRNKKRERMLLGRSVEEIFDNPRERIPSNYIELRPGWFLMTKLSTKNIESILQLACEVAGVQYNVEFKAFLRPNPRKR